MSAVPPYRALPAKPIIDLDVVIESRSGLPEVIERLGKLGYRPAGDLGISGREAFDWAGVSSAPYQEALTTIAHHLYVCDAGNRELARHVKFRDYLRDHPAEMAAYGALKRALAERYPQDRTAYNEGKTAFVESILTQAMIAADPLLK